MVCVRSAPPPGAQILTYYAAYQLYKNGSTAQGSQRLTQIISQEGQERTVRVNYAGEVVRGRGGGCTCMCGGMHALPPLLRRSTCSPCPHPPLPLTLLRPTPSPPVPGDTRLDPYLECAAGSPEGVLCEDDIEQMCHDLKEPTLLQPLLELRERHLRNNVQTNRQYTLLPSS